MSIRSIFIVFCLWWALAAPARGAEPPPTVLVVGDSLSAAYGMRVDQGWVALLQGRLKSKGYGHRVVNASSSGETTGGALARLPRALERHRPEVVVIELGGNDGLRGLPIVEIRGNLDRLVELSVASGARVLLVGMRIPPNYGPSYTREFHELFEEISRRHSTALVPFFLEDIALDESLMLEDGLHPSPAAQPKLLNRLWPQLEPLLAR